jgi:ATP-dependent RNA helicase DeaD
MEVTQDVEVTFRDLGLSESTLAAVEAKGFITPSPIQAACIPMLLRNEKDIIGRAQTGTGKTAAFGLPLIDLLDEENRSPQAIVITPTRELALQVANEIISFKGNKRLQVCAVYGGANMREQLRDLNKGVHIVVGTPGRIMDHIQRGSLDLSGISHVILDEADEMLDMGFRDDIETILRSTPENNRMLLFSATMPREILDIARKFMGDYEMISVKKEDVANASIEQMYYDVYERDKLEALVRIMETQKDFYGIIFCQTKIDTDSVANKLIERGYGAEALHGDVSQSQRERILAKFKKKSINILVATDVAARGIDVNDLTHVINYALPQDPESYIHRIGRTGRAGKKGVAISLIAPPDFRKLNSIKRIAKTEIKKGTLPGIQEVINSKLEHLKDAITATIAAGELEKYLVTAEEMLAFSTPEEVVAALLKQVLADTIDESNFGMISEVVPGGRDSRGGRDFERRGTDRGGFGGSGRFGRDRDRGGDRGGFGRDRDGGGDRSRRSFSGETGGGREGGERLFIALGKLDNLTPRTLVDLIHEKSGVPGRFINEVKVMEKFSFVSVSDRDADRVINALNKDSKGNRTIAERSQK